MKIFSFCFHCWKKKYSIQAGNNNFFSVFAVSCDFFRCSKSEYCIHSELACNQVPNCGRGDNSDEEEGCKYPLSTYLCPVHHPQTTPSKKKKSLVKLVYIHLMFCKCVYVYAKALCKGIVKIISIVLIWASCMILYGLINVRNRLFSEVINRQLMFEMLKWTGYMY